MENVRIVHDGLERSFSIYLPTNFSESKDYPVLFVLHGGGGKARGIIKLTGRQFNRLADRDNFIAVYPIGFERGWNDGARDTIAKARKLNIDDVGFFDSMIDYISTNYPVDPKKIFACGISNGGFMVQRLAYELSRKFQGIGVVAANMSKIQSRSPIPDEPTSVIYICGTRDPLVPYGGGHVTVFKEKRGEILSVEESVNIWKKINGCNTLQGVYSFPDKVIKDNCTATKTTWINLDYPLRKVVKITIENGGHTWPGTRQYLPKRWIGNTNQDFNGCEEIWEFFKSVMPR